MKKLRECFLGDKKFRKELSFDVLLYIEENYEV
jgi:hypothetical protein